MLSTMDKLIGLYHFATDRAPSRIPDVTPRLRAANPWLTDGQALVARIRAGSDIRAEVERVISLLGALHHVISRGDRVLLKPNFNSPDPFPASTDLNFLRAVTELLLQAGARVVIGESSGGIWRPTRKVFRKLGVDQLARELGVDLVAFDDETDGWVRVRIAGQYLKAVTVPRVAYEADRIVYLPCMKTHNLARFSGALKLAVGFMHPGERRALHAGNLEQKIADINLCWQPDLIIMDGRKAFASGGPDKGQVVQPGLVLASGDAVALDVEAMKILLSYESNNRLMADPWQAPQICAALRNGLAINPGQYRIVE